MANCVITYNGHTFNSENELDIWLRKYQVRKTVKNGNLEATFAIDVEENPLLWSKKTLDAAITNSIELTTNLSIFNDTKEKTGPIKSRDTYNSMAITTLRRFWEKDQDKNITEKVSQKLQAHNNKYVDFHNDSTKAGDDWDKILTYLFSEQNIPLDLKKANFFEKLNNDPNDPVVKDLIAAGKAFVNQLKQIHGKNCIFYTFNEIKDETGKIIQSRKSLSSTNLGRTFEKLLTSLGFTLFGNQNVTTEIHCTPDLIVIDEAGKGHVYDFKASYKLFGDNWMEPANDKVSRSTRRSYAFQEFGEGAIIKQLGIDVVDYHIIPAFVEYEPDITNEGKLKFKSISIKEGLIEIPTVANRNFLFGTSLFPNPNQRSSSDAIEKTFSQFEKICPVLSKETPELEYNLTAEYFWNKKKPLSDSKTDAQYKDRCNYKVYFNHEQDEEERCYRFYVDTSNEETIKQSFENFAVHAEKYIDKEKKARQVELKSLADSIEKACRYSNRKNATEELQNTLDYIGSAAKSDNSLMATLGKYILNDWDFVKDEVLNQNGFFIFEKTIKGQGRIYDLVIIDKGYLPLNNVQKFARTGSEQITGNFEREMDNRKILSASYGHLLMMRALLYITNNKEAFANKKLNNLIVTTLHPYSDRLPRFTGYSPELLTENWNYLLNTAINHLKDSSDFNLNEQSINESMFVPMAQRCINNAAEILETEAESYNLGLKPMFLSKKTLDKNENAKAAILEMINDLKAKTRNVVNLNRIQENEISATNPIYRTLYELEKALAFVTGQWEIMITEDIATQNMSPASESTSPIDRALQETGSFYFRSISTYTKELLDDWMAKSRKWHEESKLGTEFRDYTNWFELNDKNRPTKDFKIKDFSDPYWNGREQEKELAKQFLDTMAEFKAQENSNANYQETTAEIKADHDRYYRVPLLRTNLLKSIAQGAGWDKIKAIANESVDAFAQLYKDTVISEDFRAKMNNIDLDQLPNVTDLTDKDREEILEKTNVGLFETDLDKVMLFCSLHHARSVISRYFLPIFSFYRLGISVEDTWNKHGFEHTKNFIEDWIRSNVFNQNLNSEPVQKIEAITNMAKRLTSFLTLSFSSTSFTSEMANSIIKTALEANGPALAGLDPKLYLQEFTDVVAHPASVIDAKSVNNDINIKLGMANTSMLELAEKSPNRGVMCWQGDVAYIAQTLPDYIHRIAVARAYIKKEHSLESLVQGEDEWTWEYDMEKDKCWEILFKYPTRDSLPKNDTATIKLWNDKRADYLTSLRRWKGRNDKGNNVYASLKEPTLNQAIGDRLPYIIDPVEQNSVKDMSELLYGNYDSETKSMIQKKYLGSLFFQFKTYGIARMWEWVKPNGAINVNVKSPVLGPNGKPMWMILKNDEDLKNRGEDTPFLYYEEDSDEFNKAIAENRPMQPWTVSRGSMLQGRIETLWDVITDIYHLNQTDYEAHLNDPMKKYNLIFTLHDLVWMSILALLVKAAFGEEVIDNLSEQDWYTRWAYTVSTKITKEGPVWQTASSLIGDGLPPSVSILKRYVDTATSVINGNTNLAFAFTNSIGATREISNLFSDD